MRVPRGVNSSGFFTKTLSKSQYSGAREVLKGKDLFLVGVVKRSDDILDMREPGVVAWSNFRLFRGVLGASSDTFLSTSD